MKKITTFILAFVIMVSTMISGMAFYPQTLQTSSQGNDTPQFSDDFSIDLSKWTYEFFEIKGGKAVNKDNWGNINTPENVAFNDAIIDVDLAITNFLDDQSYVFMDFKTNTSNKVTLFLKKKAISYLCPGEVEIAHHDFETKKEFQMRFVLQNGSISVQIKNGETYEKLADVLGVGTERGGFSIRPFHTTVEISRVTIYNKDSSPVKFTDKAPVLEVSDGSRQLEVSNITGKSLTWTSSNENVATVDENGVVTPKTQGKAVITATTENGKQDTCNVIVISRINAIAFHKSTLDMYAGETEELLINFEPGNANNQDFKWNLSEDNGVVELFGDTIRSKAVCAKKPGTVKVIGTSVDTGLSCECVVTVTEKPPVETRHVEFELNGDSHKIPENIFGMHTANSVYTVSEGYPFGQDHLVETDKIETEILPEIKVQSIRTGTNSWSPLTGKSVLREDSLTYTLEDYYNTSNTLNIPQVVCLSMLFSVDENIEFCKAFKSAAPDKPLYVEFGNETYAIAYQDQIPTVEDYIEKLKDFSTRVRQEIPDIKIAVPALGFIMTETIKNDPNNFPTSELDQAYTQGTRAITWDSTLAANSEYYDAIVIHSYSDPTCFNHREKDMMKYISEYWSGNRLIEYTTNYYNNPEIEIWMTEYGILSDLFWDSYVANNRDRFQILKSLGAAVSCAAEVFRFVDRGTITFSHYHCFNDGQGFGVVAGNEKLPQYYAFSKVGDLLENNNWYYGMYATTDNGYYSYKRTYSNETRTYHAPDVEGWAFGTSNEVKQMAFLNCSEQPTEITVKNATLKPTWRYWSEHPFPDYLTRTEEWTAMPKEVPLPEELDESYSETITLQPFSFTVVDVNMQLGEQVSPELKEKMTRSVFVGKNENWAYGTHFKKTKIDMTDSSVTPIERDGKIWLPVRFAALAFDIDVYYDEGKDELKLSVGQTKKYIREGDSTSDLVSDTTVRNYVREPVEMADAPIMINDKYYMTLESLAELLEINVVYEDENAVILSEKNPTFTKDDVDTMFRLGRQ